MNIHDFSFTSGDGRLVTFSIYKGKVLLIVNIASACTFTPQIHDLQAIYRRYAHLGFEILAFPSNDFGSQEPLPDNEITGHCQKEFGSTFEIFQKSHVLGQNKNQVFEYLSKKSHNKKWNARPWWNFQKYLIDKNGDLVSYWFPFVRPTAARMCNRIERELNTGN